MSMRVGEQIEFGNAIRKRRCQLNVAPNFGNDGKSQRRQVMAAEKLQGVSSKEIGHYAQLARTKRCSVERYVCDVLIARWHVDPIVPLRLKPAVSHADDTATRVGKVQAVGIQRHWNRGHARFDHEPCELN